MAAQASSFLRPCGTQGLVIPRIGLGVMSAAFYGSGSAEADEAATLSAIDEYVRLCASQNGPAFLDTAFIYSNPNGLHSESIIAKAVVKHGRSAFLIATKFGSGAAPCSSSAEMARQYAESVARLGTAPDLYYQHRPDPARPTAEVVAELKQYVAEGKCRYIGLSECTPAELRAAHAVHPITAIQMEWSLAERGIEAALVPVARELGVGIVAYSPLGRGLLTASIACTAALAEGDRRAALPRFAGGGALAANAAKAQALAALAGRLGCSAAQLALAWLLAQGEDVFPIPGSKTAARVAENVGACGVALSAEALREVQALDLAAVGPRYGEVSMRHTFEARL